MFPHTAMPDSLITYGSFGGFCCTFEFKEFLCPGTFRANSLDSVSSVDVMLNSTLRGYLDLENAKQGYILDQISVNHDHYSKSWKLKGVEPVGS
jgi:hypothetical protein